MGSLYLWGRSIQEMGGDVVIGLSIYGVVVIDGSLYSRFYGIASPALFLKQTEMKSLPVCWEIPFRLPLCSQWSCD